VQNYGFNRAYANDVMMGSSDPLMGEAADTNELNAYLTGEEPRDLGNGDFVGIGESGRITTDTGEETPNRVRGMAQRYAQSLQGGARSLPDIVSDSSKPVDKRRPVDRARVQELRPPAAGRNSALGPPPEISMQMVIFILIPVLVGLVAYTTSPECPGLCDLLACLPMVFYLPAIVLYDHITTRSGRREKWWKVCVGVGLFVARWAMGCVVEYAVNSTFCTT